jgi:carboxyl-terminal processing protease
VDKDTDPSIAYEGPLVVLTSRFSASASEIFAGAMQDYGRALIVGDASTHGKGTVQTVQELNRFVRNNTNQLGALKFTIRKFYRASGASTQLEGVIPDVILPSMNNHADVGEASLPGALPGGKIDPAKYEPANMIPPHLAELRKRSEARVEKDGDFAWLRQEVERYQKVKSDKSVSLNEAARLKEKKEAEARADARKKELRARPEPNYKQYDLTLKLTEQPGLPPPTAQTNATAVVTKDKPKEARTGDPDEDMADEEDKDGALPVVDIHLDEARRILLDLIELSAKDKAIAAKTEEK